MFHLSLEATVIEDEMVIEGFLIQTSLKGKAAEDVETEIVLHPLFGEGDHHVAERNLSLWDEGILEREELCFGFRRSKVEVVVDWTLFGEEYRVDHGADGFGETLPPSELVRVAEKRGEGGFP